MKISSQVTVLCIIGKGDFIVIKAFLRSDLYYILFYCSQLWNKQCIKRRTRMNKQVISLSVMWKLEKRTCSHMYSDHSTIMWKLLNRTYMIWPFNHYVKTTKENLYHMYSHDDDTQTNKMQGQNPFHKPNCIFSLLELQPAMGSVK